MDKQKVVVVLLIVAIVLSAINLFMSASFDFSSAFRPAGQAAGPTTSNSAGELAVGVGDNGGNSG